MLGWWRPQVQGWTRVGVDALAEVRSPHAHLELKARPQRALAPELELRAGAALTRGETAENKKPDTDEEHRRQYPGH